MNKGFTLIELLVVIAIIGILSSVVLASVQNAKYRKNCIDNTPQTMEDIEFCKNNKNTSSCDTYKNYPMKDVPARCIEYFNTR